MKRLWPYQQDVIAKFDRAVAFGQLHVIIVAPTGAGKTIIAAEIIKRKISAGQKVLVLAHTREIIRQTSEEIFGHGIIHGAFFQENSYKSRDIVS